MEELNQMQRWGLTPAKAVVIAALAVVLIVVVAVQWFGGQDPEIAKSPRTVAAEGGQAARPVGTTQRDVPSTAERVSQRTPWPSIPIDDIVQYDPFRVPEALMEHCSDAASGLSDSLAKRPEEEQQAEAEKQRESARKTIQQAGVRVIISGTRGTVATIGSRTVRVGDVIDGFVIEDIRTDGVVMAVSNRRETRPKKP